MTYFDIIKEYGKGKGEAVMWAATRRVSDFLEPLRETHEAEYHQLMKDTYAMMCGPHYNEEFATCRIGKLHFTDKAGKAHHAPHWTVAQYREAYEQVKPKLKQSSYTCWDLAVTLEMLYTDTICLLRTWFPTATDAELDAKIVESAVNYLNDEDYPHKDGKIWRYFEG